MVKILLGRDGINPDKPGSHGQTPLWAAACDEHAGVVKILPAWSDVKPNKPDKVGQTPLLPAACLTHGEWWKFYSDGTTLIPTHQLSTAERYSIVLFGMGRVVGENIAGTGRHLSQQIG